MSMAAQQHLPQLVIASHNAGKVREIGELLDPLGIKALSAADAMVDEPEETGATFADNALLKARNAGVKSGLPSLADDSGLAIPALGGAPGIYSARWAGPGKNFNTAFVRIQNELAQAGAQADAPAYFICALCLYLPQNGTHHIFEGRIDGKLHFPARGDLGFGYDPVFIPEGYSQTFAEIDPALKNRISHRARAFTQLLAYLEGRP